MEKFTDLTVSQIISILKAKLKVFEEQGIKVDIVESKYSEIYMETKVTFNIVGKTKEAEAERKKFFEENCESIGLKPEDFGKQITLPNLRDTYIIAGIDFHAEEPVLLKKADSDDNSYYRMSIVDVKKVL